MISPEYCRTLARYNAWQNRQYQAALEGLPLSELQKERGAFFGSILGTLNHLLWADRIWMSRFDPSVERPAGGIQESPGLTPTLGAWSAERFYMDGKISHWAASLRAIDLAGAISWHSEAAGRDLTRSLSACTAHMFNHQTHHRGQVHAMMTAAGMTAPVSDLLLMPE